MICPYCGHFRKANATMVGRVRRGKDISALCTKCSKRFMVNAETILEGEDETEIVMCRICRTRQAEPGMLLCNDCWSYQNERRQTRQRQEKVEKERKERRCLKPKKSIDELNEEANRANDRRVFSGHKSLINCVHIIDSMDDGIAGYLSAIRADGGDAE